MTQILTIIGPGGERLGRHFATEQTGPCVFEARELPDGSLRIFSIHYRSEKRASGRVLEPSTSWEVERATYPPGIEVEG